MDMHGVKQWGWVPFLSLGLLISSCGKEGQEQGLATQNTQSGIEQVEVDPELMARFDWLRYEGHDPILDTPKNPETQYSNPILTGFYPDPSITRSGDKFYIVNSTFSYFPGLPVFESTDLVNWTQIGNAIDRPDMLDFKGQKLDELSQKKDGLGQKKDGLGQKKDGLGMSRGVFAPVIKEHNGTFYIANTCVDCQGNFIITAKNPAGPWSDPVWLPEIGGIDPSLFFDEDGKVYLMNNDGPPEAEPLYSGHRAIWMREIDPKTFRSISEPIILINGGVRREEKPIWIEGPSIYKHGDWYYLSAAEGGTALEHSQVILRAKTVLGPYEAYEGNPIMTQRHMPANRDNPITSVGHAAFVVDDAGKWWASFLGVRPYEGDFYNTGRETFLLPVTWKDGWPVILEADVEVPYVLDKPSLPQSKPAKIPMSGNFSFDETFEGEALDPYWLKIRVPSETWHDLEKGELKLRARADGLGDFGQPSFIGRRQQHMYAEASTSLTFSPENIGDEAGLSAFQNDEFYYALGVTKDEDGNRIVQLSKRAGENDPARGVIQATEKLSAGDTSPVSLKIIAKGDAYDFFYKQGQSDWILLHENADGKILSTRTAGGFIGVVFGMYAVKSEN